MNLQRAIFTDLYRRAKTPEALPWHREGPPPLLERIVAQRSAGRALDVGCGVGVHVVYLAQRGYSVTGVDFIPAALEAARSRAKAAGVQIELVEADVTAFEPPEPFDLVVDSGCLHHVPARKCAAYHARLEHWLAPGADYLLVHFAKRHLLDWRPVGPKRRSQRWIGKFVAPLQLAAYEETHFDVPFPVGRSLAGVYWFRNGGRVEP